MAWQTVPGLCGKVFVPEQQGKAKRNGCPDCFACQQCSDDRCTVCKADQQEQLSLNKRQRCASPHKEVLL